MGSKAKEKGGRVKGRRKVKEEKGSASPVADD